VHLGQGPINYLQIARIAGYERQIFAACYTGAIARVDLSGQVRGVARIHAGAVKALRLHPEKYVGVSCSADGALLSWNLDGTLIERFPGHMAIVDDVDIEPNGKRIASVSRDFTMKLYGLDSGKLLDSFPLGRRSPKSVCFFDQNTVIVSNYWGQLIRFGLDDGSVLTAQIARNGISGLAKQGPHVVAVSYDGSVFLVRQSDLQVVATMGCMTQRLQTSALI
jgi:WD40 repeat protein